MSKKPAWLFNQSGVIPYRVVDGSVQYILVTSSKGQGWVFPKGAIERFMTPEESAMNEALEEAGVKGEISDIGEYHYSYEKWGGTCTVKVYAMSVTNVLEDWEESKKRERVFVCKEEALDKLKEEAKEVFMAVSQKLECSA